MRSLAAILLLGLFLVGAATADEKPADKPKSLTPEQAADAVLAAVKAKDEKALKSLAEQDDPDPWLVADQLCFRGEPDAAGAFAIAALRVDTEALPAYVESRRGKGDDQARRERLAAANAALGARKFQAALDALGPVESGLIQDVVGVRLAMGRGIALAASTRWRGAHAAHTAAAEAAAGLGWLARAAQASHEAGMAAYQGGAFGAAGAAWQRRLALSERRGDRRMAAATLGNMGIVYYSMGDYAKALSTYEQALAVQEALGDKAGAATALGNIGLVYASLGDYAKALSTHERALAVMEALGDKQGAATKLGDIGSVYGSLGDYAKALSTYERALAVQEALGDKLGAATTLGNIGVVYTSRGDYAKALSTYEQVLAAMEVLGDKQGAATALGNIGLVHTSRGDYAKALSTYEQALAAKEALGDRAGAARTLGHIGTVHYRLGDYARALSTYEQALAAMEALGGKAWAAATLGNIGNVYTSLGDYAKALSTYEQALAVKEALGDKAGAATTLGNIGNVYHGLGDYAKALSTHVRALAAMEVLGNKQGAADALGNIGLVYTSRGDYAKALSTYEQALAAMEVLGDKAGAATTLGNIGNVYCSLGDYAKALSTYEKALAAKEALGNKAGAASTLGNIGLVYDSLGDYAKALSTHEQALAAKEALGDKQGAALTLGHIGAVYSSLGDYAKALSTYEQALAAMEALGDKQGAATTLGNIGSVYYRLGDYARALATYEQALAAKEALGDKAGAVATLGNIGLAYTSLGDYAKALTFARRAVVQLGTVVSGLGAEAGAGAREPLSLIYDVGARAALAHGDPSELTFFLESGRAGALLEGLNAREALWSAVISSEMRAAEAKARVTEAAAMRALHKATVAGDIKTVRARRLDLRAAQGEVSEVIARVQREAKAGASVVYPEAASLDEIRATLSDGDVLVLYGMLEKQACALVVTRTDARIVSLGESARIHAAVEALRLGDRRNDSMDALAALSKRVVEPLGLPERTKRLLVSPSGVLGNVPFAALIPQATVAYVPSGTTYRLLLEDRALRGVGVLALGDPDYETRMDEQAVAVVRGGIGLVRLPATREEAKAVGSEVLLGPEATEAGLAAAVGKQGRWQAVHFACHGLVNMERPALSSLALTPAGTDDGFLTCLDVFRMKIPADLVVLSACETAKGKVVKTEGIVGMVRAFMFAGAPRVICSLWKVDDEATQALMIKFYELWNPKEGKGLGAAAALKEAQKFVRSHEKWRHPYYWAAWVLWGLPE